MDDSDQIPETESLRNGSAERAGGDVPQQIDRYRVERLLGEGGFGRVYLARDDQLQRHVAIKVPHAHLISRPEDADAYLAEAQTVVSLEHPNVVPVHDVGSTTEFPCYIVSKFIEGESLAAHMTAARLPHVQAAELVATIADALHYSHKRGVVHRDIKPGNILIDTSGKPFIVDFGLALREQDLGKRHRHAGTPQYMSPEQARGEGHRVDGRSDIFSLGVVFYELLVGRRPFRGESQAELMEQITTHEPRPPRQIDDGIPRELERICLMCLTKDVTGRYTNAGDLGNELKHARQSHIQDSQSDASAGLLSAAWDMLDPDLQDAFSLAYNKKRRLGKNRISTRDLFQALMRIQDDAICTLIQSLPPGTMPEPIDPQLATDEAVIREEPLLSDCVKDSLHAFREMPNLPRKLSPTDLFVDIGKHGHGPSVRRLREHGVTADDLDARVSQLKLPILKRSAG